jgi:hypothetical protein
MHIPNDPLIWLKDLLISAGLGDKLALFLSIVGLVLIILLLSRIANLIVKETIRVMVFPNCQKQNETNVVI